MKSQTHLKIFQFFITKFSTMTIVIQVAKRFRNKVIQMYNQNLNYVREINIDS